MSEQVSIRFFMPNYPDYDTVFAWIRFPDQVFLYVHGQRHELHRISCKEHLTDSLRLLEITTKQYGDKYQAMLIRQSRGEKAKTELYREDKNKNEEDVINTISGYIRRPINV